MTERKRGSHQRRRGAKDRAERDDEMAPGGMKGPRRAGRRARSRSVVEKHTVVAGDSLSKIAQKYYGSAEREKWMAIYEANKELIGDNPSLIQPGQVLEIPKLS